MSEVRVKENETLWKARFAVLKEKQRWCNVPKSGSEHYSAECQAKKKSEAARKRKMKKMAKL